MSKLLIVFASICATFTLSGAPVGSIKGYVRDASGAVVPNVSLSLQNESTNVSLKTVSDATGYYQFLDLAPANYSITAEAAGFRKVAIRSVEVLVDQNVALDVKLE